MQNSKCSERFIIYPKFRPMSIFIAEGILFEGIGKPFLLEKHSFSAEVSAQPLPAYCTSLINLQVAPILGVSVFYVWVFPYPYYGCCCLLRSTKCNSSCCHSHWLGRVPVFSNASSAKRTLPTTFFWPKARGCTIYFLISVTKNTHKYWLSATRIMSLRMNLRRKERNSLEKVTNKNKKC